MSQINDSLTVEGGVFAIRDSGSVFFARKDADVDARWRVTSEGTIQAGAGTTLPALSWGRTVGSAPTVGQFIEVSATATPADKSVGVSLNDLTTGSEAAIGLLSKLGVFTVSHLNGPTDLARISAVDRDVEVLTAGKGVVLTSPDGLTRRRLRIDNDGDLRVEAV